MLGPEDLPRVLELSTAANWNQTANDWRFFLEHAHAYGLEWGPQGIVGTTVAWDLPPASCWIAMVIVAESCRGQGFARLLMQRAIAEAEARGMAPALDATHFGEPVYLRMGFGGEEKIARLFAQRPLVQWGDGSCFRVEESMLGEVAEFEASISGFRREAMLLDRLRRLSKTAWAHRDAIGALDGVVFGREGRVAGQIGPLLAKDAVVAKSLLAAALGDWSEPAYLDVPIRQNKFRQHLEALGFSTEREFKRMTRPAGVGATDWSRTFAIAGPDLG